MIASVTVRFMDCRSLVGIGFSGRVVGLLHVRSLDASLSVRGIHLKNDAVALICREEGGMHVVRLLHTEGSVLPFMSCSVNWMLMAATLSIKN